MPYHTLFYDSVVDHLLSNDEHLAEAAARCLWRTYSRSNFLDKLFPILTDPGFKDCRKACERLGALCPPEHKAEFLSLAREGLGIDLGGGAEVQTGPAEAKEAKAAEGAPADAEKAIGTFTESTSTSAEETAQILFEKALPATPIESEDRIRADYERVKRSWGSTVLVEGAEAVVREIVLGNLQRIAREPGFEEFSIVVDDRDVKYAQVNAFFATAFVPVRAWRGPDKFYACGNSLFTQ
jgi:hypothetical protein